MSLYQRGDIWWYRFFVAKKMFQGTTRTTNKSEARDIESTHRTDVLRGGAGIMKRSGVPNLKSFEEQFFKRIKGTVSEGTLRFYTAQFKVLTSFQKLADTPLNDIDEKLVNDFVQWRIPQTTSKVTVNHALRTLRRALRLAHRWNIVPFQPRFQLLKGERGREYVLSFADEKKYLAVCPPFLNSAACIALDTGMRLGELCGLLWSDMKWEENTLTVRGKKTKASHRDIPMTVRVRKVLKKLQAVSQCDHVLSSPRWPRQPARRNGIQHAQVTARQAAGLPAELKFHSFRHTYCTRLADAGADAFTIKLLAGHESITISAKYVHKSAQSSADAMKKLENLGKGK